MSRVNQILINILKCGDDTYVVSDMDFKYLTRMAKSLENINEEYKRYDDGEYDCFDFGEKVIDILDRT